MFKILALAIALMGIAILAKAEPLYVGGKVPVNVITVCKTRQDAQDVLNAYQKGGRKPLYDLTAEKGRQGRCVVAMGDWTVTAALGTVTFQNVPVTLVELKNNGETYYTLSFWPVLHGRPI